MSQSFGLWIGVNLFFDEQMVVSMQSADTGTFPNGTTDLF